jgi:hypothetical protein
MMRIFSEDDGVSRALPINMAPDDQKVLDALTRYWPPVVDGFLFLEQREVDAVIEFRAMLKDLEDDCKWKSMDVDDVRTLLCFVRARKFNLKAALHMFRHSYEWRKQHDPQRVVAGFVLPAVIDKYGTGGFFGFDREGSPVFVDRLGQIDPGGVLRHVSAEELLECEYGRLEYTQALTDLCVVRDKKPHWGITIVMDLTGLGVHHMHAGGMQALKKIMQQSDLNYPERAKRVLVINAPFIFTTIWKIVQHFLDPVTREKIQIYHDGAKDHLLKYIAPDQLPVFLGGTGTNGKGDAFCNPPVRAGGRVPKDFREPAFEDSMTSIE